MTTSRRIPSGTTTIRHGYTLDDLGRAAAFAVASAWARAADYVERLEAAWQGVVDRLIESEEAPTFGELVWSGQQAVNALVRAYRHDHGLPSDGVSDPDTLTRGFQRFWWCALQAAPGHDSRVVDYLAVRQIMAQLTDVQRGCLLALAVCGDYREAAAVMDLSYQSCHTTLSRARRRFFELWHEGEAPSRMWGRDRRKWREGVDEVKDHRSAIVRRRASWRRQAKAIAS